jgi:hypothetical protein
MTTPTQPPLSVTITFPMSYDRKIVLAQLEQLTATVLALLDAGMAPQVEIVEPTESTTSLTPAPKRRGRPPGTTVANTVAPPGAPTPKARPPAILDDDPAPETEPVVDLAPADGGDDEGEDLFSLGGGGRTGAEAKEIALGGMRHLFNAGHKPEVAKIRASMGVRSFQEIEAKDGHRFLKLVEEIMQTKGMRV